MWNQDLLPCSQSSAQLGTFGPSACKCHHGVLFGGLDCATLGDMLCVAASSPIQRTVVIPATGNLLLPGAGRGGGRKEKEAGTRHCLSSSECTAVLDLCRGAGNGIVSAFYR